MRSLPTSKQAAAIVLFDAFQEALEELHERDMWLFTIPKSKAAVSHRLAMYLETSLQKKGYSLGGLYLDVQVNHTDILLHDRGGKNVMSIMVFHDYIPKDGVELLKKTMAEGAVLTLSVAFLSGKDYLLIYRIGAETIDYYHYMLADNYSTLRMQKDRPGADKAKGQLQLLKTPRPKRKKKN